MSRPSVRWPARLRDLSVEAVAVCLLWSTVNNAHEVRVGEIVEEVLPGIPLTLSSALNPVIREYPRASAKLYRRLTEAVDAKASARSA